MSTANEDAQLRELSEDLARAGQSAADPRCIALCFCTPAEGELRLTMQQWIDLEAISSPVLQQQIPEHPDELERAANVFGLSIRDLDPGEAIGIADRLIDSVKRAFGMCLGMQQPGDSPSAAPDGFGLWLPVFVFLIAECGCSPVTARQVPVGEAFALLAGRRRNQGWEPKGETYAQRDVLQGGLDA